MRRSRRNLVTAGIAATATVALCGTALASWSSSASGSGRASARTSETVAVDAAVGAADLYPGFTGGDVHFTLTNPNPFPVVFTSMSAGSVTSSSPVNCPAANVTASAKSGLNIAVAGGATSANLSIADVISMSAAAPNGCQGVAFTIAITLSGAQS